MRVTRTALAAAVVGGLAAPADAPAGGKAPVTGHYCGPVGGLSHDVPFGFYRTQWTQWCGDAAGFHPARPAVPAQPAAQPPADAPKADPPKAEPGPAPREADGPTVKPAAAVIGAPLPGSFSGGVTTATAVPPRFWQ